MQGDIFFFFLLYLTCSNQAVFTDGVSCCVKLLGFTVIANALIPAPCKTNQHLIYLRRYAAAGEEGLCQEVAQKQHVAPLKRAETCSPPPPLSPPPHRFLPALSIHQVVYFLSSQPQKKKRGGEGGRRETERGALKCQPVRFKAIKENYVWTVRGAVKQRNHCTPPFAATRDIRKC